jgi:hypothetical protein
LHVSGVKPFGESVVDLGQHLLSFCSLALLLPQPRQTHHRPQFPRFRSLLPGLYGRQKTGTS